MSLIICPECKKEISSEALLCPNCGFNFMKIKANKRNKGYAIGCVSVFVIILVICFICSHSTSNSTVPASSVPSTRIDYKIIKQWSFGNGYGKIIAVDTCHRNEKDLRVLGENLKYDTRNDQNATVLVFDDIRAANLRDKYLNEELNKTEGKYFEKHCIASYDRNTNINSNHLSIFPNSKFQVDVDY